MTIANVGNTGTFGEWLSVTNQTVVAVNQLAVGNVLGSNLIPIITSSFGVANTANTTSIAAFAQANIANTTATTARNRANQSFGIFTFSTGDTLTANAQNLTVIHTASGGVSFTSNANTLSFNIDTTPVFAAANTAQATGVAAFGAANTGQTIGIAAFAQANTARDAGNTNATTITAAFAAANTGQTIGSASFSQANIARDAANTAQTTGVAAFAAGNTNATVITAAFATANLAMPKTGGTFTGNVVYDNCNVSFGSVAFTRGIVENVDIQTLTSGNINVDTLVAGVHLFSSNLTANVTVNLRGNSTTRLDATLAVGQMATSALILRNGSGATAIFYPTTWQIDGAAATLRYSGGTAFSAGHANSYDSYAVSALKTAANTWIILASQTQYN